MSKTRILLVDNEPDDAEWISRRLRAEGYHVVEARNASDAVQVLGSKRRFDLAVIDYRLSGSSKTDRGGPNLAREIEENLPKIAISATADSSDIAQEVSAGLFKAFFLKDVIHGEEGWAQFSSAIRNLCAGSQRAQEAVARDGALRPDYKVNLWLVATREISEIVVGLTLVCFGAVAAFRLRDVTQPGLRGALLGTFCAVLVDLTLFIYSKHKEPMFQAWRELHRERRRASDIDALMQHLNGISDPVARDALRESLIRRLADQLTMPRGGQVLP